jgi:hypothetical protein
MARNRLSEMRAREDEMAEPNCIVCGERTTCFLHAQSVCANKERRNRVRTQGHTFDEP